jgi:hypothetical protein
MVTVTVPLDAYCDGVPDQVAERPTQQVPVGHDLQAVVQS